MKSLVPPSWARCVRQQVRLSPGPACGDWAAGPNDGMPGTFGLLCRGRFRPEGELEDIVSLMLVAMNAGGSAPVSIRVNLAATLPALPWVAVGLLTAGAVFLLAGALLIVLPARSASRERAAPASG
jgi:hypothetical protein